LVIEAGLALKQIEQAPRIGSPRLGLLAAFRVLGLGASKAFHWFGFTWSERITSM